MPSPKHKFEPYGHGTKCAWCGAESLSAKAMWIHGAGDVILATCQICGGRTYYRTNDHEEA